MLSFDDDEYTVRLRATPGSKRGTVLDADGDPILEVVREGFRGPTWFTFREPNGTPRYHVRTIAKSVGPVTYTTRRYPIVDAATDEPVAEFVRLRAGPFKRRFAVEAPTGSRLATVETGRRLWAFLRAPPLGWLPPMWLLPPLSYDVRTAGGTRIAAMQARTKVVGREFAVRMPYAAADFPWIVVFVAVVIGGRAGTARRLP